MLIKTLEQCTEIIAGDHTMLRELLHPDRDQATIHYSLAHVRVLPGKTSLPHRLTTAEVYYLLSGQGMMTIDGESRPVQPEQAIYIPPGATQYIANTGEIPLVFLCIVDPPWRAEDEEIVTVSSPAPSIFTVLPKEKKSIS